MNKKQPSGDLFETWMEGQQKMMEQWKEFMGSFFQLQTQENSDKDSWFKPEKWLKIYQDWFKASTSGFENLMKLGSSGSVSSETWQKAVQSLDIYIQLFNLWTDMARNFNRETTPEKISEISSKLTEGHRKLLDVFLTMNMPEPAKSLLNNATEISGMYNEMIMNFIKPWLESSSELKEKATAMFRGDREAYLDFVRAWRKAYEESYGKIIRVPVMGMTRENFEKILASMDSYVQYMAAAGEFTAQISKIGYEAMESMSSRYLEILKEGKAPQTFREYYRLWMQTTEAAYFDLFKTDSFAKLLGQLVNAGVRFKKRYDDLLVDFIGKFLPIPTNDDMDSVYKTTYQLKKENRELVRRTEELEKRLMSLEEKLAGAKGQPSAT